jgi:hypothetical protein
LRRSRRRTGGNCNCWIFQSMFRSCVIRRGLGRRRWGIEGGRLLTGQQTARTYPHGCGRFCWPLPTNSPAGRGRCLLCRIVPQWGRSARLGQRISRFTPRRRIRPVVLVTPTGVFTRVCLPLGNREGGKKREALFPGGKWGRETIYFPIVPYGWQREGRTTKWRKRVRCIVALRFQLRFL